jgi:ferric hydroxamate transport system substrate-binding protein
MRRRRLLAATLAATAALALTACGTTEPAATTTTSAAQPISITDATGATIDLDGPATRVVGLEWNTVENLVSLGVKPVGVADVKGYDDWSSSVPLTNSPKDVGTRDEPSVDAVAALAPDLIVTTTDLSASAVKQLKKIAPVLLVTAADSTDQIAQMFTNLDLIATATGTSAKAKTVEGTFTKALAAGKAAIAKAGLVGTDFAFADGYVQSNQVGIRAYTKRSLIGQVTAKLGLVDAWSIAGDKAYGLAYTDVEGLTKLGDVRFLYLANDNDGTDVFTANLPKNDIWKTLPFVKDEQVHRLPDGIWMFGGPATMTAYVHAVVAALTA